MARQYGVVEREAYHPHQIECESWHGMQQIKAKCYRALQSADSALQSADRLKRNATDGNVAEHALHCRRSTERQKQRMLQQRLLQSTFWHARRSDDCYRAKGSMTLYA